MEPTSDRNHIPLSQGGVEIITVNCVMIAMATFWTGLRLFSRRMKKVSLHAEDYVILLALVCFYGLVIDSIVQVVIGGLGHHITELQLSDIVLLLKMSFGFNVLFCLCLTLVKCSICLTLKRIFSVPGFKLAAIAAMVLSCAWGITAILIAVLICQPVASNWDVTGADRKCGNETAAYTSSGILDLVTDIVILILPIPMVLKLQLPLANKIGVCAIFGAGLLTMVATAFRTAAFFTIDFHDFPYSSKSAHIWGVAEPCVAIMVASSPMLRPVFDKVFRTFIPTRSKQRPSNSYGARRSHALSGAMSTPDGFERMDDEIALNRMDRNSHGVVTQVIAGKDGHDSFLRTESTDSKSLDSESRGGIYVRTSVTHSFHEGKEGPAP